MKYLTLILLGATLWVGLGCEAHGKVGDDDDAKATIKVDKD